jgi:hypothetical protein
VILYNNYNNNNNECLYLKQIDKYSIGFYLTFTFFVLSRNIKSKEKRKKTKRECE